MSEETGKLDRGDGTELAWRRRAGRGPGVVFLGGFNSDMTGSKAEDLSAFCAGRGQAFLRFDYSGHGASGGKFAEGTIGRWAAEAEAVLDALTEGPQVLIGSSMGGWIALLLALRRPARLAGLIGIAAAPDFTAWGCSPEQRATLAAGETVYEDNPYGPEPTPIHPGFWSDAQAQRLLGGPIALDCPVRLLHGQDDEVVPPEIALRLARALRSQDVQVTLVKGGDHRLSRESDIALLLRTVAALTEGPSA